MKARGVRGTHGIEVIAAHPPQNARKPPANLVSVPLHGDIHAAVDCRFERSACGAFLPLGVTLGAERCLRAIREHNVELSDMVDGLAVDDGPSTGRVIADHAAKVGSAGSGDVRAELEAMYGQGSVKLIEHHARLNPSHPS